MLFNCSHLHSWRSLNSSHNSSLTGSRHTLHCELHSRCLGTSAITESYLYDSTFCVSAAGFRPYSPLCDSIFLPTYSTPTLHILGRTDVIVVEERSKTLLDVSSNKRVEYHDGGMYSLSEPALHLRLNHHVVGARPLRSLESELAQLSQGVPQGPPRRRSITHNCGRLTASFRYSDACHARLSSRMVVRS